MSNKSESSMKLEYSIRSIGELLGKYKIFLPIYQREYSWEKENISTLINDVLSFDDYYIGSIMVSYNKDSKTIELIDGQQRIITCYLVLAAIYNMENCKNKEQIEKLLFYNEKKPRIIIDERTADQNNKVFSYICKENEPTDSISKTNEYKQYKNIKTIIETFDDKKVESLYKKIVSCNFVMINTHKLGIKSDTIFLNLNTKGMKLSNESIVRSMIITNLEDDTQYDSFRNSWYNVFSKMDNIEIEAYLSDYISIFETSKESKIRKNDIVSEFRKAIDKGNSKGIFETLVGDKSSYYASHLAVTTLDTSKYNKLFENDPLKLDAVFSSLSFIKKIKFKQFDIALKSIFIINDEKKDKPLIRKNITLIELFVKIIFLFGTIQGLQNKSPSLYGNDFVKFAVEMRDKTKIKENIKNIISTFKIRKITKNDVNFINELQIHHDDRKEMKYIVALISFLDGDNMNNYNGDHFLPESSSEQGCLSFANIIPVSYDEYGIMAEEDKIIKYKEKIQTEKHIEVFLRRDYYKNFKNNIKRKDYLEYRKERYNNLLVNKYNKILDDINSLVNK